MALKHKFTPWEASFLQGSLNRQDWKMSIFLGLHTSELGSEHLLRRLLCRWVIYVNNTQTPLCARTDTWAVKKVVALCGVGIPFTVTYCRFLLHDVVLHHGRNPVSNHLMDLSLCLIPPSKDLYQRIHQQSSAG